MPRRDLRKPAAIAAATRRASPALVLLVALSTGSFGQPAKAPWRTLTCAEGSNTMAFAFDGKGGAKLARIEGKDVGAFPDLRVEDWTVRIVAENAATRLQVANARGARLSLPVTEKSVGRLTWNDPPNSKADVICDIGP